MTRFPVTGFGIALMFAAILPAMAQSPGNKADMVDFARGNTLIVVSGIVVSGFGPPTAIFFAPTGRWRASDPKDFYHTEGTWRADGSRLCTVQTAPVPPGAAPKEHCIAIASKVFGETWRVDDPRGGELAYTWKQGAPPKMPWSPAR